MTDVKSARPTFAVCGIASEDNNGEISIIAMIRTKMIKNNWKSDVSISIAHPSLRNCRDLLKEIYRELPERRKNPGAKED
jgi:hypothetical protein